MTIPVKHILGLLIALVLMGQAEAPPTPPTEGPSTAPEGTEVITPTTAPASAVATPRTDPLAHLPSGAKVAVIPIQGLIYDFTYESLERRVNKALAGGANVIVLEFDTKGGVVISALKISKYIKTIPVPTIAWINNEAYSAGILCASACDVIVMSPVSATGDCAPIAPGTNMSVTERKKIASPILLEFHDSAVRHGYDYTLFHAMVELGVEVYEIQNVTTGEKRLVSQGDYEVMVKGAEPDAVREAARQELRKSMGVAPDPSNLLPIPGLSGTNTAGSGGAESLLGGSTLEENLSETDRGQWTLVKQVHDGQSLLTLTQTRAIDLGLARQIVKDDNDLKQMLGASSITRIDVTWSENVGNFLTNDWVRGILIVLFLLGAYMEFQAPGISIPGGVAALALILLLVGPFLVGLAEVWHIVLFFIGFILLMIELLVIPGFGIVGVVGIVMMFVGIVLAVVPTAGNGPVNLPAPEMWQRLQNSIVSLMVALLVSSAGFYAITKYFGSIPFFRGMVLRSPRPALTMAGGDGGTATVFGGETQSVSGDEAIGAGQVRVGDTGRAVGHLRPSGRAEVAGRTIDVVSLGGWIEAGRQVKVVEVTGNRIVVDQA